MFETALHLRVALAAVVLVAAAVAYVPTNAASTTDAPITGDESPVESAVSSAPADRPETAENVSVTFAHEGERLVLRPADGQNVTLRTNAEPGTRFEIELWSNGTLRSLAEAVTDDGSATATFDLRGLEPETELRMVARYDDRKVGETTGVVRQVLADVVTEGNRLILRRAENQTVRVRTDAPPGRELPVQIKSETFVRTARATISDDGTATATFDLSGASNATHLAVSVGQSEIDGLLVNESATVRRDGTLTVNEPASNYEIRGHVGDPFVTQLDVRVTDSDSSFSASRTVDVGEDNTFTATFDLSSLPADTEVSVEVGGIPRSIDELVVTEASGDHSVLASVEPSANVTIRRPGEAVLVHAAPNQTIRGTTNLQPGTELVVTAENSQINEPNDFSLTETVTVGEDGSFAATPNFSEAKFGANFTVTVEHGLPLAEADGRVVNESVTLPTVETTRPTTDESAFTAGTTTTPDDNDDGHVDEFVPGFGVPAALLALLGALLLARRNRT